MVARPLLEGSVAVRDGRRLSFAEFGTPHGRAVLWMHGTPGSRRQVPMEARDYAVEHDLRIIGLDRPGVGSSTPHLYDDVLDWTGDLVLVLETLGIDDLRCVGLSGGGPYVLAAAAALPERVRSVGVLGGVAPTRGVDAAPGGVMQFAASMAPLLVRAQVPLGFALSRGIWLARPVGGPVLDLYARFQPEGDKHLLGRPEFRAMFLDDLVNGSRFQMTAPVHDAVLFTKDWGFSLADVRVPVRWWHGDQDHIVPLAHGQHVVDRLPDARLIVADGESHLGGLARSIDVLETLLALPGDSRDRGSGRRRSR